jgi:hypothetical protein
VIVEALDGIGQRNLMSQLGAAYKAINAPIGELARRTLLVSTRALSGDDATYNALEKELASVAAQRNTLTGRMIALIEAAEFQGTPVNGDEAHELIAAAQRLIDSVH